MTGPEIFKQNILAFNQQLSPEVITTGNLEKLSVSKPDGIVFLGMGGSGIPGSILQNIVDYAIIDVPIVTWKDAGLPSTPFKNPLFVCISFSGNTRETLDGFTKALQGNHMVAVVAGGGTLLEEAKKRSVAYAAFNPGGLQPRQGCGLTLYATLSVVKGAFSRLEIKDLSKTVTPDKFENIGQETAAKIKGKTTLVYTTLSLSHLGQLVKINIVESGKALGFSNTIPEVNHNELNLIETKPQQLYALFITNEEEYKERKKEFELTAETLSSYLIPSEIIIVPGKTALEVTANAAVIAQWIGLYVATGQARDPLGLEVVNRIKQSAKEKGL